MVFIPETKVFFHVSISVQYVSSFFFVQVNNISGANKKKYISQNVSENVTGYAWWCLTLVRGLFSILLSSSKLYMVKYCMDVCAWVCALCGKSNDLIVIMAFVGGMSCDHKPFPLWFFHFNKTVPVDMNLKFPMQVSSYIIWHRIADAFCVECNDFTNAMMNMIYSIGWRVNCITNHHWRFVKRSTHVFISHLVSWILLKIHTFLHRILKMFAFDICHANQMQCVIMQRHININIMHNEYTDRNARIYIIDIHYTHTNKLVHMPFITENGTIAAVITTKI